MKLGRDGKAALVLLIAAACAIWLWPVVTHINSVPFWSGSEYSDLLVSHYPNAIMVHTSLRTYHQVPLWNPTILSGTPANADPLVGLWYLPRWLTFLQPSIWMFNILVWMHLVLAGVGAYWLVRLEGASKLSAVIAGVVMAGLPKLMAHLSLGHVDLLFAICWTPWAVAALKETLLRVANNQSAIAVSASLGLIGGVIFLADPRWLFPVVFLILIYGTAFLWPRLKKRQLNRKILGRLGGSALISGCVAALGAAPLALPLIQYTALSTRRILSAGNQQLFALPLVRVTGLVLPFNDVPEWVGYIGLALGLLFVAGVTLRSRPARRWGVVALVFLLLALGSATPIYTVLTGIPGFDLLRVPARVLAMVGIAAALGGAHALDALLVKDYPAQVVKKLNLVSVGLAGTIIALAALFFLGQDDGWSSLVQVVVSGFGSVILILVGVRWTGHKRLYPVLWLALIVLDLLWMNSRILEIRPVESASSPDWMEVIESADWGQRRVFSPSYSLGQDQAAQNQIEMVDGVHPLQLSAYYKFAAETFGFDPQHYSVTLPPFPDGDPSIPWNIDVDRQRLDRMNIEYILSAYPLSTSGLRLINNQDIQIYENPTVRPRAWVEPAEDAQPWLPVEQISWSPNRIRVQAVGPGLLVLSEVDYPGWTVTQDGRRTEARLYDGLLRSVQLDEGQHIVEWVYRPTLTWIGLGGWGLLILSLAAIRLKWWS